MPFTSINPININGLFVFIEMKPKIFFLKKKKMVDSKKPHFPALPILNIFVRKFMELIVLKDNCVAQLIWL